MNITIISVGKIKEKYIKLGIEEFSKRLSRYCKLTMVEVPDEKTPDNASEREMELIKDKEGKQILNKIKDNMYVIAMDLQGDMKTSEHGVCSSLYSLFCITLCKSELLHAVEEHISATRS